MGPRRPDPPAAGPLRLGLDLRFSDSALEQQFLAHHAASRVGIGWRFALYRACALAFVAARAGMQGELSAAMWLLTMSACSFIPAVAASVIARRNSSPDSRQLAQWAAVATDLVQAVTGMYQFRHIAPSDPGTSAPASLAYLVHASGALWPHFYSAFSPLPFSLQLLEQAAVTLVLLCAARRICAATWALRRGYCVLHTLLHVPLWAPLRSLALGSCGSDAGCAGAAAGGSSGSAAAAAPDLAGCVGLGCSCGGGLAVPVCVRYQAAILLLLGYVAAAWAVFCLERRLRLRFLADWRCGGRGGGGAAAQRRDPPAPTSLDFFLNFALPTVLCMWSYVGLFA